MSRPYESEPMRKTCFTVSPSRLMISPASPRRRSRLAASKSEGSTVPSSGAAMAMAIRSSNARPPMGTDQFCNMRLIADPRIEEHVRQVDQTVDHHVDEREKQDQALHGGKVARKHGIHGEPAQPRNGVDRFRH